MSRFFPDPHGPVNEHPGPDFDHPQAATNPDPTQARKPRTQHEPDRTAAASRARSFHAPHQVAEAS